MADIDTGRRAAHVILDTSIAWSDEAAEEERARMVQLAAEGLYGIGCVTATFDDETDTANVDISDLAGGVIVLVHALVERVALATGLDREVVVAQTREIIDKAIR